jgi:hypothetical protein
VVRWPHLSPGMVWKRTRAEQKQERSRPPNRTEFRVRAARVARSAGSVPPTSPPPAPPVDPGPRPRKKKKHRKRGVPAERMKSSWAPKVARKLVWTPARLPALASAQESGFERCVQEPESRSRRCRWERMPLHERIDPLRVQGRLAMVETDLGAVEPLEGAIRE